MKNFVNEKKGKSRCSDGERTLKCDYFIAGNSNPAVVHLLLLYSIIKIEKGLTFEVSSVLVLFDLAHTIITS